MAQFNNTDREMSLKLVYVGCALGGKTTSLERIHERIAAPHRNRLVSLNTANDRTLFFDLLPVDLGQVGGYSVKLQLFTVPGQVQYATTRQAVLTGVDAVVVVVDSDPARARENRDALQELASNLKAHGLDIRTLPLVLQHNKRDLPNALPVDELNRRLNPRDWPWFESIATSGSGVLEPFLKAATMMADQVVARYKFPPSFGERLHTALEQQLTAEPAAAIPQETITPQTAAEQAAAPAVAAAAAALDEDAVPAEASLEPITLNEERAAAAASSLDSVREALARRAAQPTGGGRQRILSSIHSSEETDLQQLLQGSVQAHEATARLSSELDRAKDRLALRESHIAELGRIARWTLGQSQKPSEILSKSLSALVQALRAAGGAILMPAAGTQTLQQTAIEGFAADPMNLLPCKGFPSLASGLLHRACPSISPDPAGKPNPVDRHLARWNIISHIASPLELHGQLLGLMTAYRTEGSLPFDKADVALFSTVALLVSTSIELARLRSHTVLEPL